MSYQVEWRPEVFDDIAAVWQDLPLSTRKRVEATLDDFDHMLATAPRLEGESRGDEFDRVSMRGPLLVRFAIDPRLRKVTIAIVRLSNGRGA